MSSVDSNLPQAGEENEPTTGTRRTMESAFDPARNSLNFLRLVLALLVVISHSGLGGFRDPFLMNHTTIGIVAVYGFFGISGYLIARSATRNNLGRYLWLRAVRIFPGYWVCLGVTAFVFGVLAWHHGGSVAAQHCGLTCYFRAPNGPFGYVWHNFFLRVHQPTIATTLNGIPWPYEWNLSIWTLAYEFACYLILAALAVIGLLRHRAVVLFLVAGLWATEVLVGIGNPVMSADLWAMLTLAPVFMVGALLYLYRDVVPDSRLLALGCMVAFTFSLWTPFGGIIEPFRYTINAPQVAAPLLAYPLFWLGAHLPFQSIGARNDYSYGVYVYASPMQQLLAVFGVQRFGYAAYLGISVVGTVPFAVASWWLVERHALRLRKIDPLGLVRRGDRRSPD